MAGFTPLRTVVGDDESAFQPLREVNLGLAPQRGLISAALSSGTDQLQGLGYSALGGAADLLGANSVRDWANEQARRNSIDAALNGRPDLERIEDQTLGTALPFAAYKTLQQAPLMGAIAGAQLVPGLGQAATATGLARLGAVAPRVIGGGGLEAGASMAARRAALAQGADFGASAIVGSGLGFGSLYGESVEGGDPSPFKALALAPLYGVAEAALPSAVKGAFRAPERLAGGLGTRMLKAGGLGAGGESATEGFQNELEMSMRGDLSDEEKFSRRLNSMVTGGVVGGSLGSIGGIPGQRQARTVDDGLFDLTSPGGAPTYNLVTQPDPLQQRINQGLGIQRNTPKDYAKIFEGAASEGSGQFVTDPATGQERELDMGEYYALSTGVALAQQSAKRQEQAKQAQLAAQEEIDATATAYGIKPVDIGGQVAFDVLGGRVYGQSTLNQIVSDLITANQSKPEGQRIIEQAVINAGLTNFDGKPVGSAKQVASKVNSALKALNLSEATEPQAAAAILNDQIAQLVAAGKNEADPKLGKLAVAFEALTGGQTPPALTAKPKESGNAGQTSAPRQPATASVAAGNPVVPGSVANTRPVPAGNAGLDRNATGTGARSQQAGAVANSSGERTAPVGERKTLKVQRSTAKSDPFQVTEDANDALEIARATGNASELEAQAEEDAGLRMDNELAGDEDAQNKAINAILRQRFGDSAEGLRQAEIAQAYLVALKKAPRGSKLKVQEGIGRRFGVKAVTVRAYGNPNELVKAGKQLGYTEQQVRDLLEVKDNTKESQTDVEENQNEIEAAVNQRNDVQVETGDKESGLAADGPRGQMSDSSLTGQLAGEFGDNAEEGGSLGFGMDDSNTWKLANARSGAGDLANARVETYANAVQSAMERIDALQETLNEFEADGLDEAAEDVRALIDKENVALQKAIEAYQEFLNKEKGKKSAAETPAPAKAPKKVKAEKPAQPAAVTGQQMWEGLRKQMPDLVAYDTLSKNEQGYLDELAARTDGKPVVAKEMGLQELMARVAAEPEVTTTEEQRKAAEEHAQDVGGTVAWQEGDIALIRGYSKLTGQPVYAFAKGSSRSRVDVEAFTGSVLSPELKARLVAIKQDLEKADAEKHAKEPFIKFDSNGLAVSKSVDARLAGVMAGWKNLLNIKANIYVTTLEDARADKDKFTGPHRSIGSAGLDANEAGSMRRMGDGYYIAFKRGTSYMKMLETLGHELGHVHQREAFDNAPAETQRAIRAEHDKFIKENAGKTGRQFVEALRARATGRATRGMDNMSAADLSSYWKSFSEWYADQVSKWATTSDKPVGVVEQFFAKLGAAIKKFYYSLKGQKYLPNETMKQFLDAVADRTIVIDSKSADAQDMRSEAMFVGEESLARLEPKERAELDEKLAEAISMMKPGADGQTIWEKTGWMVGKDGKWRYWLSDDNASLKLIWETMPEDTPLPLKDVLDHPELFRRYPKLEDFKVIKSSKLRPGNGQIDGREISIGAVLTYSSGFEGTPLGVLLHEIQHGVQDIEGFSSGGSTRTVDPFNPVALEKLGAYLTDLGDPYGKKGAGKIITKLAKAIAKYRANVERLQDEEDAAITEALGKGAKVGELGSLPAVKAYKKAYDEMLDYVTDAAFKAFNDANLTRDNIKYLMYQLISGEIEARETAARFKNPDRQLLTPYAFYPRKYQLVQPRFGLFAESSNEGEVLKTINRLPPQARTPVSNIWRNINRWTRKGLDRVVFTADLLQTAAKQGLLSATKFQRLLEMRGAMARDIELDVEKVADLYAAVPEKERGYGPGSVNEFIFDSTRTGKWGYDNGNFKADGDMAQRFNALSEESRRFVEAVFDHGKQMLALKKQTVLDSTNSIYDTLIAKETDPKAKAKLEREKAAELAKFQRLFAIREGLPYAPIKRVGDYVVIAKSDAYLKAEEEGNAAELRKLEKDPDHYHVSFMESENEAARLQEQLEEQGFFKGGSVEYAEKEQLRDRLFGGESMLNAVTKLKGLVDAQIDDDTSKQEKAAVAKMQRLVSDLYLQTLAENSARKTEMRRRGVAGEVDMLKSFTMQGRADAQFLASVKYASQTQDVIQEMRKQVKSGGAGTRNRRSELFNEIMARYAQTLDYTPTPVADKLTRLTSIWFLATSPAYYLQNLTQPFMLSLPVMSGRHDYTRAANELLRAYNELTPLMKSAAKGFNQQLDYTKLPKDVQTVISELVKRGRVDIGIDTELGRFEVEGDSKLGAGWNKVDKFLRSASQKMEAMNRLSTAIAAYRLELQKSNSAQKATEYADRILTETHGDYTRFNAPRAFNTSVGKVMLQFRKFQLIQLSLLAKLFKDAGFSTAEKRAAAKSLAYVLGHTGVMAGVAGLPGYAAIAWMLGALLGDDDDKFDLTQELRKLIGDDDIANLIMKGAPAAAGVDLSGKLGMGNALSVLPFTDVNPLDRRSLAEAIGTLVSGPAGGLAFRAADGIGQIANGNYYKGVEMLMPTGVSNMMRAYRVGTEGVTRRNGDMVMSADEVNFAESFVQALGFTPTDQAVRSERAKFVREVDQNFQDRSAKIKNDYVRAAREGDAEGKAEAREAWKKLQAARREKGYTPQPLSELLKAPQQSVKRERQVAEGVPFNKQNRQFVQQLVEN